jgi:hypothetical protein
VGSLEVDGYEECSSEGASEVEGLALGAAVG